MDKKSKKIEQNLNLNINKDDFSLNDYLYCWQQFGSRPNKLLIHNNYSTKLFNELFNQYSSDKNCLTEIIQTDDGFAINDKIFVKIDDNIYCSYIILDRSHENSTINEVIFFYKSSEDFNKVQDIVEKLNKCLATFDENINNILNTISFSNNVFELEPINIDNVDIDNFNMYYSKNVFKEVNKLVKNIKSSTKGLNIIYGEKGTGKTSIINYLANKLNGTIIYIPNNTVDNTINNSEFRKFLKNIHKPIIIIDDCETLFYDFFQRSNIFANNLLQMVDGFLANTIEVNVITIFNLDKEDEIDDNLLNANNLSNIIKFDYLSPEEATDLSEHIGKNKQYKNKTLVLDVIKNKKTSVKREVGL